MAKKLGVKKSDILNVEGSNMAVKLALAETNIIQETKAYLEDEGVNLTAFSMGQRALRSSTVILVKNLPASTVESDLLALFEPFGSLGRLLLPPAKTLGLVEFLEENEAKVAFSSLAYTRFKSIPLFLEWAPIGVFKSAFDKSLVNERKNARHGVEIPKKSSQLQDEEEEEQAHEDPDGAPTGTLFVKNLNFDTREPGLLAAFSAAPGLRSARIPTKTDKKRPGQTLSLGYGFLEFESRDKALSCLKSMQGLNVDGHVVNLKFSNAAMKSGSSASQQRSGTSSSKGSLTAPPSSKLIVRNVPFEASKKELKDLFSCGFFLLLLCMA
jgi:multiple RNA-binding domain-containing protein 1